MTRYFDIDKLAEIARAKADTLIEGKQAFNYVEKRLDLLPAADVAEVKHAHWSKVYQNNMATVYECSNCKHLTFGTSDYCICGAKMDGGKAE